MDSSSVRICPLTVGWESHESFGGAGDGAFFRGEPEVHEVVVVEPFHGRHCTSKNRYESKKVSVCPNGLARRYLSCTDRHTKEQINEHDDQEDERAVERGVGSSRGGADQAGAAPIRLAGAVGGGWGFRTSTDRRVGADMRCRISVRMSSGHELVVRAEDACAYRAVADASDRLKKMAARTLGRMRDRARRVDRGGG